MIFFDKSIFKEVISRICTDIASNGTCTTDSNGRQLMKRKINHRPTYEIDNHTEPISQNYYPITSIIQIEDENNEMVVITDRAQGGSSLQDGCIELMLHRRLLYIDSFGLSEALNEEAYGVGLVATGIGRVTLCLNR